MSQSLPYTHASSGVWILPAVEAGSSLRDNYYLLRTRTASDRVKVSALSGASTERRQVTNFSPSASSGLRHAGVSIG